MIYLIRHGQTDWNIEKKTQGHSDIPLNERGREQARSLSLIVSELGIDSIISSDLLRARETAEIINKKTGVSLEFDQRLRELNYGDLEGIPRHTLDPSIWDVFNDSPEKLNAEPFAKVFNRIKHMFDELSNKKGNILVVTHGGPLRMIMYYANFRDYFDKKEYALLSQNASIKNADLFEWDIKQKSIRPLNTKLHHRD